MYIKIHHIYVNASKQVAFGGAMWYYQCKTQRLKKLNHDALIPRKRPLEEVIPFVVHAMPGHFVICHPTNHKGDGCELAYHDGTQCNGRVQRNAAWPAHLKTRGNH